MGWRELAGTGRVASFVVVHRAFHPQLLQDVPYVVAEVTLDGTADEVTMVANVVQVDWARVEPGMHVSVIYEEVAQGFVLPAFRPK